MRLIPVQLREANPAVAQSDSRDAFEFPPPTFAKLLLQIGQVSDRSVNGNRLNVVNRLKNLKVHGDPSATWAPRGSVGPKEGRWDLSRKTQKSLSCFRRLLGEDFQAHGGEVLVGGIVIGRRAGGVGGVAGRNDHNHALAGAG